MYEKGDKRDGLYIGMQPKEQGGLDGPGTVYSL